MAYIIKGVGTNVIGGLLGAVSGGRTDPLAKNARDEYVTEHMEIAAYQMLITTAATCGKQQTVQACQLNLRNEVRMANLLEQHMPLVALLAFEDDDIQEPTGSWSNAEQVG